MVALELTPGLIALLAGTGLGALSLGLGLGWILRPAPPPPGPRTVFGDGEDDAGAPRPAPSAAASASGRRSAVNQPRIQAAPSPDFESWKDRRLSDELKDENTELRNLFTLLPGITRRITETLKRAEIASILCDMVTRLCIPPPDKVLIFLAQREARQLVLVAKLGYLPDTVFDGMRIGVDEGLIGECIRRLVVVERPPRPGAEARGGLPLDVEIAAPMLHNRQLLGVIAVAGVPPSSRHAKRMVTVAANLGALALANAEFVGQIQRMADSDALTGLYNKRYFFEQLERALDGAGERRQPLSLFMFDIDHFKKYNDRNGHQAGDEALRLTGRLIRDHLQEGHLAARYGGEEFVVVLPGATSADARRFAEAVRTSISSMRFPHGDTQPLGLVSISGGVATFPEDGQSPSALIERADARLYEAKNAGRNRVA